MFREWLTLSGKEWDPDNPSAMSKASELDGIAFKEYCDKNIAGAVACHIAAQLNADSIRLSHPATSNAWKGHMEVALRSGRRGADEVIAELSQEYWPVSLRDCPWKYEQ